MSNLPYNNKIQFATSQEISLSSLSEYLCGTISPKELMGFILILDEEMQDIEFTKLLYKKLGNVIKDCEEKDIRKCV